MSDATKLARRHTEAAVKTIAEIMDDPLSEDRDRLRAAETLLDRGYGKSSQAVILVPGDKTEVRKALAAMDDAELMQIVNESRLPRLTVDAEFEEVVPASTIDPLLL
jgi:cytochrome P450